MINSVENQELMSLECHNNEMSEYKESELKKNKEREEREINELKVHKVIAKIKNNTRKGFKRRILEVQPIIYQQLYYINKYVLYGMLQIETFYKDYPSPYEKELIDNQDVLRGISRLEKSLKDQNVIIYTYQKSSGGLIDFEFLINHFEKIPDQRYFSLSQYLRLYQKKVENYIQHTNTLSVRMKQRLITEEEIQEAYEQYRIKFEQFVNQEVSDDEFYVTSLSQLNLQFFQIEQKYMKVSFALLSLLGLEHRSFEATLLHNGQSYLEQFGEKRLDQILRGMQIISNDIYEWKYVEEMQTVDRIRFFGENHVKTFIWKDKPKWMKMEDSQGILIKLNIPLGQIKSILEIRSQMTEKEMFEYGHDEPDFCFEYSIESEIFLEKFYPQLFGQNIKKFSLNLKQELMELPSQLIGLQNKKLSICFDDDGKQNSIDREKEQEEYSNTDEKIIYISE